MNVRRIAKALCLLLSVSIYPVSLAGAQAAGQPSMAAIRAACAEDAQKLCAGVQPGGGRIVACLKEHKDALSDRCKQAAGMTASPAASSAPGATVGLPSAGANGAAGSPAPSSGSVPAPGNSPAVAVTKAAPVPAAPAPKPNFVFGSRDDYRWQLGLGVSFIRFQSNIYNASLVGTNTTVSYFTNGWLALEGDIVTGFAPTINVNEHVKYFGGGGGIRVGARRNRFEPWVHALVGGAHLQPQTAGNSRNGLSAQAGIGLDYRLHSRFSIRAETDWVYTTFFNQTQNNFQGALDVVFHF